MKRFIASLLLVFSLFAFSGCFFGGGLTQKFGVKVDAITKIEYYTFDTLRIEFTDKAEIEELFGLMNTTYEKEEKLNSAVSSYWLIHYGEEGKTVKVFETDGHLGVFKGEQGYITKGSVNIPSKYKWSR